MSIRRGASIKRTRVVGRGRAAEAIGRDVGTLAPAPDHAPTHRGDEEGGLKGGRRGGQGVRDLPCVLVVRNKGDKTV
jgi:hypothetical protein